MTSPHTPIAPSAQFRGRSGVSPYADYLMETDWAVGQVVQALDDAGVRDHTLVLFTADNGTSPQCRFADLEARGVYLREHWRGWKADAYEGGHRVPFVVRWPGVVRPGTRCHEIISLVDIMATLAEVVDYRLPADAGEDSRSLLPLLRGERPAAALHEAVICHSAGGFFAIRQGPWKLLLCRGSGGWSPPREGEARKLGLPPIQLYNLRSDPRESTNVYRAHPKIVQRLVAVLRRYVEQGRSTPGTPQSSSIPIPGLEAFFEGKGLW